MSDGLAENYAEQALAGRRRVLGPENPDTLLSQGKFAESEPVAREALEAEKKARPNDWQRYRSASLLGASLSGEKNYAEGGPLLLEVTRGCSPSKTASMCLTAST
jgi:hypothetical protein